MIRIYFDWNIYSYIRTERGQVYSEVDEFLSKNKSSVLLVYSPAHLQDLQRSYFDSEKGRIETEIDLEFLGNLTSNHCLCYDYKEKVAYPNIADPIEYFHEIFVQANEDGLFSFENIFDSDDPLGKLWRSYWKLLKLIPVGIDFSKFTQLPKEYQVLNDFFKYTKENNSVGSLLEDMLSLIQNPDDFEKIYKAIRAGTGRSLKLNTNNDTWDDPVDYLDGILKKNKLQQSFFELTDEVIENSNKKATRFDYFTNYYVQLDMFGYYRDKKVPNLMDDAAHSFYAAHTDVFVTDDENTHRKSSALYKQLNIETEVVHSNELINCIRRKKLFNEERSLLEQVEYLIGNSLMLLDTVDDELNPARVYLVRPVLLDFFNRMQISEYANSTSVVFYKRQGNYSQFMFWTEIEAVVNKVVSQLGIDLNNKESFRDCEMNELLDHRWEGRVWVFNRIEIVMKYIESPFGLTLKIEVGKSNYV